MNSVKLETANRRRALVTGATGFIGRHLFCQLEGDGYEVVGLSRSGTVSGGSGTIAAWSLGDPIPYGIVADVAIHLAHDFRGAEGAARTISGTLRLARELEASGTERQIFVSSYSAGTHASSRYGQTKALLEEQFLEIPGAVIVRPGLVLGDGGLFARIAGFAKRYPIVPLPDGGHGRVPVIEIDLLCEELLKLLASPSPTIESNMFHNHQPTLREIVFYAANELGRKPIILNVPMQIALPLMKGIEFMGIRLPVSSDSLEGFARNQSAEHKSSIEI
jgi:uncharacterized protein YbjT (DUF2867 family)